MTYAIQYSTLLNPKEVAALPKTALRRIRRAIEEKLTTHPEVFGKPLRRSLRGYRRLRVGDYRVIFRIENTTVKIFLIAHRAFVYEDYQGRFD